MTSDDDTHFLATFFLLWIKKGKANFKLTTRRPRNIDKTRRAILAGPKTQSQRKRFNQITRHFITWLGDHNWDAVSIEL